MARRWIAEHWTSGEQIWSYDDSRALNNAILIHDVFVREGWTHTAACAILGNMWHEGQMNPWTWEGWNVPTKQYYLDHWVGSYSHGMGLVGFTPANRYINAQNEARYASYGYSPHFSDPENYGTPNDGNAQTHFLLTDLPTNYYKRQDYYNSEYYNFLAIGVDMDDWWDITWEQLTHGNYALRTLVGAIETKYEEPAAPASSYSSRCTAAQYYFQNIPEEPEPQRRRMRLKVWQKCKPFPRR